jgi:alkylation response protein AidB-like acyl-CoA dehydrogenase
MGAMTELATKLRDELEPTAAEIDRDGVLPIERYARLHELGYLRALVPTDLGGLGADLADFVAAQRELAWACGSTALAVNMHHFQVGGAAEGWYASGANEAALRRVVDDGIVLASTGAEAIVAGAWDTPTTAVADGDTYVLNGRKFFCSQADVMDVVRVNARAPEGGDVLVFAVPARAPGVEVVPTWDTLGMRATVSHDVVLRDVRVPASALGARLSADGPAWDPQFARVIRWFLAGVSGVYTGIADRARDAAYAALGGGRNTAHRDESLTDLMVGQLEAAHFRGSAVLGAGVRAIGGADVIDGLVAAIAMKEEATRAAVEVVDRAVDLTGGRAYFRTSVLERLVRDVRAAQFHPPSAPVSHQMIGRHARAAGASPA